MSRTGTNLNNFCLVSNICHGFAESAVLLDMPNLIIHFLLKYCSCVKFFYSRTLNFSVITLLYHTTCIILHASKFCEACLFLWYSWCCYKASDFLWKTSSRHMLVDWFLYTSCANMCSCVSINFVLYVRFCRLRMRCEVLMYRGLVTLFSFCHVLWCIIKLFLSSWYCGGPWHYWYWCNILLH